MKQKTTVCVFQDNGAEMSEKEKLYCRLMAIRETINLNLPKPPKGLHPDGDAMLAFKLMRNGADRAFHQLAAEHGMIDENGEWFKLGD